MCVNERRKDWGGGRLIGLLVCLSLSLSHTHTHTHKNIYMSYFGLFPGLVLPNKMANHSNVFPVFCLYWENAGSWAVIFKIKADSGRFNRPAQYLIMLMILTLKIFFRVLSIDKTRYPLSKKRTALKFVQTWNSVFGLARR